VSAVLNDIITIILRTHNTLQSTHRASPTEVVPLIHATGCEPDEKEIPLSREENRFFCSKCENGCLRQWALAERRLSTRHGRFTSCNCVPAGLLLGVMTPQSDVMTSSSVMTTLSHAVITTLGRDNYIRGALWHMTELVASWRHYMSWLCNFMVSWLRNASSWLRPVSWRHIVLYDSNVTTTQVIMTYDWIGSVMKTLHVLTMLLHGVMTS